MPELKELHEQIKTTWEQMKAKNDDVLAEAKKIGEARAEDKKALEKMSNDLTETKKVLDNIALKIERQTLIPAGAVTAAEAERDAAYKKAFMKWSRLGGKNLDSSDYKALREAMSPERKALVENTAGLYLVPQDMEKNIIRAVPQPNSILSYVWRRPTIRNKVSINSLTDVIVGWGKIELGKDITESEQTPSQGDIAAEDWYGLSKIGEDELQDSDANLEAILADSFRIAIENESAKRIAIGRGHTTYSEPAGIAVDATLIASYKVNWAVTDTADTESMIKLPYKVKAQYRTNKAQCPFVMNSETELALRLLRSSGDGTHMTGQYLWQPSLQVGQPNTFDGYPIVNQDDMNYPADALAKINVVFGNFRMGYMLLERSGIAIQRLDELYAEAGLVGFKVHRRVGGGVVRNPAFYGIYNNT